MTPYVFPIISVGVACMFQICRYNLAGENCDECRDGFFMDKKSRHCNICAHLTKVQKVFRDPPLAKLCEADNKRFSSSWLPMDR